MNWEVEKQKAKDLIAKSEHIALLLPKHPSLDCLAAAEVIARALVAKDKHVGFLPNVAPDASKPPDAFFQILNPRSLTREFIIAVDTARSPVAELRYEKHPDKIEVILSPKTLPIREEAFSFREGKVQCDCLLSIDVPDIESLSVAELGVEPQFFTETPIINIGGSAEHKPYGEINFFLPEEPSLSLLAYEFVKAIQGGPLEPEAATITLAGIMSATDNFRSPVKVGAHLAAADLLQIGADQSRALTLVQGERPVTLLQLIARASVRSKETQSGRVLWSFLTAEDFEKTGRLPSDAPAVLEALPHFFSLHPVHVLLWQEPATHHIRALLRASPQVLGSIAARTPGELRNQPGLALEETFTNFREAEERIASLLDETL